ncbi:MAG: hypothetical protein HY360_23655 [Verrucomicrobia bacterium]|nr:hypothetical protein [Verrucomicrobiota bacterium]
MMKDEKVITGRDSLFEAARCIVGSIQSLNRKALREYTPVVEGILRSRSRDVHHIEHTLDGLLDFCGYAPVLLLYKKLCRHYFLINPVATASYINAYREMWDTHEPENTQRAPNAPTNRKKSLQAATNSTCPRKPNLSRS